MINLLKGDKTGALIGALKAVEPFIELSAIKIPHNDVSSFYYQQNARKVIDQGRSLLSAQKTALAAQGVYKSSLFMETGVGMARDLYALKHEAVLRQINEEVRRYNTRVAEEKHVLKSSTI